MVFIVFCEVDRSLKFAEGSIEAPGLNPKSPIYLLKCKIWSVRQDKNIVSSWIHMACWVPLPGQGGHSLSSLLMSLIFSRIPRKTRCGLCSLSCVVLCEGSSTFPYSRCSFRRREDSIFSLRRYDRTLQIGSRISMIPCIPFQRSVSTTSHSLERKILLR